MTRNRQFVEAFLLGLLQFGAVILAIAWEVSAYGLLFAEEASARETFLANIAGPALVLLAGPVIARLSGLSWIDAVFCVVIVDVVAAMVFLMFVDAIQVYALVVAGLVWSATFGVARTRWPIDGLINVNTSRSIVDPVGWGIVILLVCAGGVYAASLPGETDSERESRLRMSMPTPTPGAAFRREVVPNGSPFQLSTVAGGRLDAPFPAQKGQRVSVHLQRVTPLPTECCVTNLGFTDPDGEGIGYANLAFDQSELVFTVTIKKTGTQTFSIWVNEPPSATFRVALFVASETIVPGEIGGPPVFVTLDGPGHIVLIRFKGRSGQQLRVKASLPDRGGVEIPDYNYIDLELPNGGGRSLGWSYNHQTGEGEAGWAIDTSGDYSLELAPWTIGPVTVEVTLDESQR